MKVYATTLTELCQVIEARKNKPIVVISIADEAIATNRARADEENVSKKHHLNSQFLNQLILNYTLHFFYIFFAAY
jgi:ribosomal protein L18